MNIFYKNSKGRKVSLSQWPLMIQEPERLYSHQWSYDRNDTGYSPNIKTIYMGIVEKTINIAVFADSEEEFRSIVDELHEILDTDIVANTPGRLYIDDKQYMSCYIIAGEKSNWEYGFEAIDIQMTIATDKPFWIIEKKFSFLTQGQKVSEKNNLDYPHDYPYDYAFEWMVGYINNDHYSECDFSMIIYGPCSNPLISIGGHNYEVNTTLESGEYLQIDSVRTKRTVKKVAVDGTTTNEFDKRNFKSSIFEKIKTGYSPVMWDGSFGFDIILYPGRSEPLWTL